MFARISITVFVLACALTACGGGGGTTPPAPGGGGGGGPTPTPSATGTPGPHSTPTPTPTPPPTPTPQPTATPQAFTILPYSMGVVDPMQIIDLKMSPQDIQNEAPYEDLVWGAFDPSDWVRYGQKTLVLSRYFMPWNDDSSLTNGYCSLQCWQNGAHPDWVMYACDSTGNPVIDGQSEWATRDDGFPDVPLDIHNPDVINYQMSILIPYLKANGYNAVAADNITFQNYLSGPNTLLGQNDPDQTYGTDGWYGCGIYQNGNFVRRYAGPGGNPAGGYAYADPNFIADLLNWEIQVSTILHANGIKLLVNHPMGSITDPNEINVVKYADAVAYEASFTNFDRFKANFPQIIQYMQFVQSYNHAYMDVDYFCENNGGPCEQSMTDPQKDFAIASYELGNEGGAGLFMSPSGGQKYSYYPEFAKVQLGAPCKNINNGEYFVPAGTSLTYARQFSGGYVVVNNQPPGGATETVTLPNHHYTDLEPSQSVTNPLPLAALDARVLLTTENGCQ